MNRARIGKTVAESRPDWPAPGATPRRAPNILGVRFDADGIGRAGMARQ